MCATRKVIYLPMIHLKKWTKPSTQWQVASCMTGLEWELTKYVSHVIPWCMKCILNYWFVDKMGRVNVILIHVWNVERPQSAFIHILIRTRNSCYIWVQMYTKQIKRSKCLLHSGNLKNRFYVRIWGPLDIDCQPQESSQWEKQMFIWLHNFQQRKVRFYGRIWGPLHSQNGAGSYL